MLCWMSTLGSSPRSVVTSRVRTPVGACERTAAGVRRHRLLVVATAVLALVFALPSCFTIAVWSELPPDQMRRDVVSLAPGQLAPPVLTVALSAEARTALAERWSAVPSWARGLRVSVGTTVAPELVSLPAGSHIDVVRDLEGDLMLSFRGTSWPATVEFVAEPVAPSPPLLSVGFVLCYTARGPGFTGEVAKRVLCTPATLLLDVVTSPLQLLTLPFWLPELL